MTMRAEDLREWEVKRPDALVLLVRDYTSMQEAVITIPRANIARAEADGKRFRWKHGDEIELHTNGEVCVVVPLRYVPGAEVMRVSA